jgi:hypothetical protein
MVALSALLAIGLATVGPSVLSADAMFALVAVLAGIGIVLAFAMSVALLADDEAPDRPEQARGARRRGARSARGHDLRPSKTCHLAVRLSLVPDTVSLRCHPYS